MLICGQNGEKAAKPWLVFKALSLMASFLFDELVVCVSKRRLSLYNPSDSVSSTD